MADYQLTSRFSANFQDPKSRFIIIVGIGIVVIMLVFSFFAMGGGDEEASGSSNIGGENRGERVIDFGAESNPASENLRNDIEISQTDTALGGGSESVVTAPSPGTFNPRVEPIDYSGFGDPTEEIDRIKADEIDVDMPDEQVDVTPTAPVVASLPPRVIADPNEVSHMLAAMEAINGTINMEDQGVYVYNDFYQEAPIVDLSGTPPVIDGSDTPALMVAAGDILYARMLTEVVSTENGPILAEVTTGALRGARLIGSFSKGYDRLVVSFSTLVLEDGRSASITAFAVDPRTSRTGLASSVDYHYFQRYVMTGAAAFLSSFAEAVAQPATTSTVSTEGSVTQTQNQSTNEEAFYEGVQAVSDVVVADLAEENSRLDGPTVTINQGVLVGVMFMGAVAEPTGPILEADSAVAP